MGQWVSRTVLSGSSVAQNGTNSHTCTFTAATSGNFLLAIVAGGVTFTTPSGWTLVESAVGNSGLYVFSKTASAGESSFSTTHNGTNYAIEGVVYEFYAGSAVYGTPNQLAGQATNTTVTGPSITGITGTHSTWAVRSLNVGTNGTDTASCTWTTPSTEDYDAYTPSTAGTGGIELSIAYADSVSNSTFTPSSSITTSNVGSTSEGVSFLLDPIATPVSTSRIETLTDNFDDNTLNTNLWATYTPAYSISETGGQLVINLQSNNPVYDGYYSVNTYDLTGSQVTVRQVQGPSSLSGCQQLLFVQLDNNNRISTVVDGPNINFVLTTAGVDNNVTIARDDTAMAWWRIRESNGILFWDTSPDGKTWTNRRSSAPTFSITSVVGELAAGTWQNIASPGTAIFDNFNTLNTVSAGWFTP